MVEANCNAHQTQMQGREFIFENEKNVSHNINTRKSFHLRQKSCKRNASITYRVTQNTKSNSIPFIWLASVTRITTSLLSSIPHWVSDGDWVVIGWEFMQLLVCTLLVMSEDKLIRMFIETQVIIEPVCKLNMHLWPLCMHRLRESNKQKYSLSCSAVCVQHMHEQFNANYSSLRNRVVKKLMQRSREIHFGLTLIWQPNCSNSTGISLAGVQPLQCVGSCSKTVAFRFCLAAETAVSQF